MTSKKNRFLFQRVELLLFFKVSFLFWFFNSTYFSFFFYFFFLSPLSLSFSSIQRLDSHHHTITQLDIIHRTVKRSGCCLATDIYSTSHPLSKRKKRIIHQNFLLIRHREVAIVRTIIFYFYRLRVFFKIFKEILCLTVGVLISLKRSLVTVFFFFFFFVKYNDALR